MGKKNEYQICVEGNVIALDNGRDDYDKKEHTKNIEYTKLYNLRRFTPCQLGTRK